jgi:diguanylate cyclase (GGDEF)-like protein
MRERGGREGLPISALSPSELEEILRGPDLPASVELSLLRSDGRPLAGPGRARADGAWLSALGAGRVVHQERQDGTRVVRSALPLPEHGLVLVSEEEERHAYGHADAAVRSVVVVNLLIVCLLGAAAFRLALSIARPLEALARAARRIRHGESVRLPEPAGGEEVEELTRSLADMTARLGENASALEESRAALASANDRLRLQNAELHHANEVLEQLSITDGLTRLHNHRFFQDAMVRETKRASRTGQPLSLIMVDLDHFKAWNDRLGHAAGDLILRRVAEIMSELVRDTDVLARYGGEEFALLAPNTEIEGAAMLAEKIRSQVSARPLFLEPPSEREPVTVSIGVARYEGDREALFRDADRALYCAKDLGRNCVVLWRDGEPHPL